MVDDSLKVIKFLNCKSFLMKKSYSINHPEHIYFIANDKKTLPIILLPGKDLEKKLIRFRNKMIKYN